MEQGDVWLPADPVPILYGAAAATSPVILGSHSLASDVSTNVARLLHCTRGVASCSNSRKCRDGAGELSIVEETAE
jgi:hypothetical protein